MSSDKSRYELLLEAIECERRQEEQYYSKIQFARTVQERIEAGFLWYPVQLVSRSYTIGDYIEIVLERTRPSDLPHKLKSGVGVRIFKTGSDSMSYSGVVAYIRRDSLKIIVSNEDAISDSELAHGLIGVEMIYDERPYTIMKSAILELMGKQDVLYKEWRESVTNRSFSSKTYQLPLPIDQLDQSLNESQKQAIHLVSQAERVGIIHGPPGTGKTTTIVQLVKQLLQQEKRILVCAPSNNAVDLLAHLLDQKGLNVLRIGNVSRIDDDISHLTLAEKARNHPEWKRIKKVKIEADEAKKMAGQFKRKFGHEERQERKDMFRESRELRKWAKDLEDRLMDLLIQESQVICTTLIGASQKVINHLKFKTVIIDEASQALEPECWNVMLKAERVILAGDHLQLAPVVKSPEAKELGLSTTLLDRLSGHIPHDAMLQIQYRMHEQILAFSNQQFYDSNLISDAAVAKRALPGDSKPLEFIDTSGCGFYEQFSEQHRSYSNPEEFYLLREYILTQKEKQIGYSIGLIAPYAQQVRFIREQIAADEDLKELNIEVDTVDGFQGQERDIMYISFVRSNEMGQIGFLSDQRRLNVAMTRAKMKLVMIGDLACLSNHKLFRDLGDFIESEESYRSAWEFMQF